MFLQCLFKFLRIDISLERNFKLGILGFIDGTVECSCLTALDVALGCIEMRVTRHDVACFHEVAEEDIFCCTSLVGRDNIVEAGQHLDSVFQLEEG